MNKKSFAWSIAALSLAIVPMSCSKDDNGGEPGGGSGQMEQYTSEESKEFIEEVSQEAMALLDPSMQKPLADLCEYFLQRYGDLGMPGEDQVASHSVGMFFKETGSALRQRDYAALTRATYYYVYDINLDYKEYAGIYEPGVYDWQKVGESKDIIFQFKDASGSECKLTLSASDNFSTGEFEFTDYDDDYLVRYNIPQNITLTLNQGGTSLINLNVVTDINLNGHTVDATVKGNVMNISLDVVAKANDNQVTENSTIKIDGVDYVTSYAVVNGSNLCDINFYQTIDEDNARTKLSSLLKNGKGTVNLLNRIQADFEVTYSPSLYDAVTTYYDNWEFGSETQALSAVQRAIETLDAQVKGVIRYNNKATTQAWIGWTYESDSWSSGQYWEYWIEPVLKFPDNTTYTFEDYFDTGFAGAENAWYNLVKKYEAIWGKVFSYID